MSIEPRKVWQVIQYIDNTNSSAADSGGTQHHVEAISTVDYEEEADDEDYQQLQQQSQQSLEEVDIEFGDEDEEEEEEDEDEEEDEEDEYDEDSYNHLIEEYEGGDEDDEDDIISYDSEAASNCPSPLMESPAITLSRPPPPPLLLAPQHASQLQPMVLDLATNSHNSHSSSNGHINSRSNGSLAANENSSRHSSSSNQSPRLVYVKLGESNGDHVITLNHRSVGVPEDLIRILSPAAQSNNSSAVNLMTTTSTTASPSASGAASPATPHSSTTGNDEELTSLTWLHDKNLIQGINLTTKGVNGGTAAVAGTGGGVVVGGLVVSGAHTQTENTTVTSTSTTATISPNCDKQQKQQHQQHLLSSSPPQTNGSNGHGPAMVVVRVGEEDQGGVEGPSINPTSGAIDAAVAVKTIAISELASKIIQSTTQSTAAVAATKGPVGIVSSSRVDMNGSTGQTQTQTQQQLQHVHKKYRREEHVKISKQQQQQQQQLHHHQQQLQLTPNHHLSPASAGSVSRAHSPNGIASPYSERSMSSRKYSEDSLSFPQTSPQTQTTTQTTTSSGRNGGSKHKEGGSGKQKHPVNVPYNPFVHTNNKPPLSFSSLIFMAIENATEKALPVKEIYAWIVKHFPYFKTAPTGWKNSVRHNLSLNKCFQKVEKAPHMGKGSLWRVEQQYRQVLMQALTRSPYHQFAGALDKSTEESFNQDTNNNMMMCNTSPSSSTISSTSSSLSTSPTGLETHHHSNGHHSHSSHNNHNSHHLNHHPTGPVKMSNGRPFDPVLFPYLSKEISKLDGNNNATALYGNGQHFNLSCADSESESTGFYENSVDGDSGHGYQQQRFNGGGGYINYSQYPYDSHVDNSTDNMDDVNAATAMLALKHGPKIFDGGIRNGHHPVITSSPSEDHTYSAGNEDQEQTQQQQQTTVGSSNGTRAFAIVDGGRSRLEQSALDFEEEEQRKKAEGVDALLNLAGFASNTTSQILMKRRASSDMTMSGGGYYSNESSMDCSSSATMFSSPSPTKRSKTRFLHAAV